ncbi:MAG TPA: DUF6325 family protein [Jiangellales bacterium]|nr:DUF6325 family protein [Jiangellales bacterium]
MDTELDEMGPVDYIVVEFPKLTMNGEAFPALIDLVERGLIRILDLAFVAKDADGRVSGLDLRELDSAGDFDLTVFEGASSGLLGGDDLQEAAAALEPESAAAVLVYENVWAGPFAAAVRRAGGQLVASGRIPVQAILAALDASDTD